MQSHIFPKLIYKRIRSHPKSRFRSLDNFSKAMQDGEKRPMLCHDCEERFSAFESKSATLFLDPYLESEKLKNLHSTWVNYYFLSVACKPTHKRNVASAPCRDRPSLQRAYGNHRFRYGKAGRCDRSAQSRRPNGMGAPHEQHPQPRGGNRFDRACI